MEGFKGGIHPSYSKEKTERLPIIEAKVPKRVVIPISQHIGAPCEPIVRIGDAVKKGQKIGEAKGFVSAPVHSSISGKVTAIAKFPHPSGRDALSIVIESDGTDEWVEGLSERTDYLKLSPDEFKKIINNAGVVGLGGATFPTHVKLSPPPEKKIRAVILNGAECEPYLTADHRLMVER
ncbi:MAG: electron transport complex subunit RsxC, partial [Nitrospirota bacterium]